MKITEVAVTPVAIPDALLVDHKLIDVAYSAFEIACLDPRDKDGDRPAFLDRASEMPGGPALRVERDCETLTDLRDLYNKTMVIDRDDTDEMLKYIQEYACKIPIW